jgi:hypothetical protein
MLITIGKLSPSKQDCLKSDTETEREEDSLVRVEKQGSQGDKCSYFQINIEQCGQ